MKFIHLFINLLDLSPKGTNTEVQGELYHPLKSCLAVATFFVVIVPSWMPLWAGCETVFQAEMFHKWCNTVRDVGRCQAI